MIPLVDLNQQTKIFYQEIMHAINRVINSGRFLCGSEAELFERAFAQYCGVQYCVAVDSGTSALELALRIFKVGSGSEVIAPALTFVATVSAIVRSGAKPVLVDVEPDTLNIDPEEIERMITPKTAALIPVHLYGMPANMDAIKSIATKHDLVVIEDAAQAHGATYKGKFAGALAHMGCFSFYPAKNLGAFGDAGAITTDSRLIADYMRMLRNHGRSAWDKHEIIGGTHRMDEIQAAILRVKLKYLDGWNARRRERVALYSNVLHKDQLTLLSTMSFARSRSAYHLFVIRTPCRDRLRAYLKDRNIETGIHYKYPIHLQGCFRYLGYQKGDFPVAEKACDEILSLPLYPELSLEDVAAVGFTINEFFKKEIAYD
jgi:dTDP-4-amino-4,6-dideoxygalactose transaminase